MATTAKKKSKTASASAQPTSPAASNSDTPVRIRMYRQGLGDCFLVTFDPGGTNIHMLIDCGSLGAKTTGIKLSEVVDDICQTTHGHVHLLVLTHEHKDHVCAFYDVQDAFKKNLNVDNVWLAWTEDPDDPLAKKIGKPEDLAMSLTHAAKALANANDPRSAKLGLAVKDIVEFAGDPNALGAGTFARTVNEAMDFARTGFAGAKTQFHKPGEPPIEPDWLPGFRFYVLGPPYSEKALQDTGEKGSSELYGLAANLKTAAMLAANADPGTVAQEQDMPFDNRFRLRSDDQLISGSLKGYRSHEEAWRRIDYDWLHSAADLALQLDNLTNNTSLALAIERISDRKVFLFPADAQEGNWLSWHDPSMKWQIKDGQANREVTATDLLNHTVFYKVGHHSSHNATAKKQGLELMDREDELVAFIPVYRAVALGRNPQGSWKMPARPLYLRLLQKCQGRVLRSDIGWADDSKNAKDRSVEQEFDGLAEPQTWASWKKSQAKVNLTPSRMYFELTIS